MSCRRRRYRRLAQGVTPPRTVLARLDRSPTCPHSRLRCERRPLAASEGRRGRGSLPEPWHFRPRRRRGHPNASSCRTRLVTTKSRALRARRTPSSSEAVRKTASALARSAHGNGSAARSSRRSPRVTIVRSPASSIIVTALRVGTFDPTVAWTSMLSFASRSRERRARSSSLKAVKKAHVPASFASWVAATAPPGANRQFGAPGTATGRDSVSAWTGAGGIIHLDPVDPRHEDASRLRELYDDLDIVWSSL